MERNGVAGLEVDIFLPSEASEKYSSSAEESNQK